MFYFTYRGLKKKKKNKEKVTHTKSPNQTLKHVINFSPSDPILFLLGRITFRSISRDSWFLTGGQFDIIVCNVYFALWSAAAL